MTKSFTIHDLPPDERSRERMVAVGEHALSAAGLGNMQKIQNKEKSIQKRVDKQCACCPRKMRVIFYSDRTYRGGHYFGKIPFYTDKEWRRTLKAGTRKVRMGSHTLNVCNRDPKPYKYEEYWECPTCYWSDGTRASGMKQ